MKGYRFVVSGDSIAARDTVYAALTDQGFKLTHIDDWSADAERGSSGASLVLGAFAGKKGRHVKLQIACQSSLEGFMISLTQGTSGLSGGLIGGDQASKIYSGVCDVIELTFRNAGILMSSSDLQG